MTRTLGNPTAPFRHSARRLARPAALLTAVGLSAFGAPSCEKLGALQPGLSVVENTGPELAVEWSGLAYDIAYGEDGFLTFKGQRAIAMMHLAMHDALQAVVPLYDPYAYHDRSPLADPIAAATTAAYEVLSSAYPDHGGEIEALRDRWLGAHPVFRAREWGAEVGAAAARAILELREDDGWDFTGTYEFRDEPGQYRTTPPWEGFALQPGFRYARPFSFADPARFRPPPPPALTSAAYAEALNEVRLQGDSLSTTRSADQTGYATWWMEFAESSVGRVARELLTERDVDLWRANRVLAHMYMALFDGYVSNWDSKYEYNHWRPFTAIRDAGSDGNAATVADPDWVPLRTTPPFPEYASAHATGCAAAYEVMAETFGDSTAFENTSLTSHDGMPTRAFTSFRAAAAECGDSRVQLGWHYRYAVDAGLEAGRSVARHVLRTTLSPP